MADIDDTSKFAEFDSETITYIIRSNYLQRGDIGEYMVVINARFYNDTYEEKFNGHFMVTIWDDPVVEEPWTPPNPIEIKDWDPVAIRDSMEPEPYDPQKPIPYVAEISQTGVMTIGWDKSMMPPNNYTVIPEA